MTNPVRTALIRGGTPAQIANYLPSNYLVIDSPTGEEGVTIQGEDVAGWTLDDYVLPRLASGLYFGKETATPTDKDS